MSFFTTDAVQVAGGQPEHISKIAKLLENETSSDFVDLNCGCPLDTICNRCVCVYVRVGCSDDKSCRLVIVETKLIKKRGRKVYEWNGMEKKGNERKGIKQYFCVLLKLRRGYERAVHVLFALNMWCACVYIYCFHMIHLG